MTAILLASASPIRRHVLQQGGIEFAVAPADLDETALKAEHGEYSPMRLAALLAHRKALAVAARAPESLIIAADQIALVEGELLNKSETLEESLAVLRRLAGKSHDLVTASCIYQGEQCLWADVGRVRLEMRPLSESALKEYIDCDKPTGTVGGYYYEATGNQLFSKVVGDKELILGLHSSKITQFLKDFW